MNIQDWFPLGLTDWISLQSKVLSRVFSMWPSWCEELTHRKRPWCWERLKVGGEGDNRGQDGWMASLMRWTWVWVSSGSWWWTGKPGVLKSMGLQRDGHNWVTELTDWLTFRKVSQGHHPLSSLVAQTVKKVPQTVQEDPNLILGSGRSPEEANGNPLQYSCLETSMDRGAWWATVHGVTKSRPRLSN